MIDAPILPVLLQTGARNGRHSLSNYHQYSSILGGNARPLSELIVNGKVHYAVVGSRVKQEVDRLLP